MPDTCTHLIALPSIAIHGPTSAPRSKGGAQVHALAGWCQSDRQLGAGVVRSAASRVCIHTLAGAARHAGLQPAGAKALQQAWLLWASVHALPPPPAEGACSVPHCAAHGSRRTPCQSAVPSLCEPCGSKQGARAAGRHLAPGMCTGATHHHPLSRSIPRQPTSSPLRPRCHACSRYGAPAFKRPHPNSVPALCPRTPPPTHTHIHPRPPRALSCPATCYHRLQGTTKTWTSCRASE